MNQNDKIICPLLTVGMNQGSGETAYCRREECAWWVEDKQKCAVVIKETRR